MRAGDGADSRYVIFNADDFGYADGINRGIVEAHRRGVVTSTSLMVARPAAAGAVELARAHPALSVGLHWDARPDDGRRVDLSDHAAVRREFGRQLRLFQDLLGRPPTHVDSHHHRHLNEPLTPVFRDLVEPLGIPLRGDGRVLFVGSFFGGDDRSHVGVPWLQALLREKAGRGWTEIGCHPGYCPPGVSTYSSEREDELRTLTDPRIARTIDEVGLRLASYADCPPLRP